MAYKISIDYSISNYGNIYVTLLVIEADSGLPLQVLPSQYSYREHESINGPYSSVREAEKEVERILSQVRETIEGIRNMEIPETRVVVI